jgi:hypothetical protein
MIGMESNFAFTGEANKLLLRFCFWGKPNKGVVMRLFTTTMIATIFLVATAAFGGVHPSYSENLRVDTLPFYTGGDYDPAIMSPDEYFTYPPGQSPQRYHEIERYIKILAESSDRVQIEEHTRTHEGRQLYNLFISSPENISRLAEIKSGMDLLADPVLVTGPQQLDSLVSDLPAVAWLGYSIHGDEFSGTDAAVLLVYHLAAARDEATLDLLKNLIIIIDPCENPDGRERYMAMLQSHKSQVPNYDRQAMQHSGVWPWGRANHYLFDLNRDWILQTQPETRGRTRTILNWHPQLVVDGHEMGSYATFLFSPPRQPINYNTPDNVMKWYDIYNKDHAGAFDKRGWPYYAGEWNEQWYPGYGSSWPTFQGAVGILYEQADVAGQAIKQPGNYLLTFHEALNHQFTSSLANLKTTADNREELLRDYHNTRKQIIAAGEKSRLQFLFVPDDDRLKMKRFIESLTGQGIVVHRARSEFTVSACTDGYHETYKSRKFPAGTYIVNTAQAMGALAKAVLEFDPHFKFEILQEERREIEKKDDSRMYEVTSWSLPLAYNIDAFYTTSAFSVEAEPITEVPETEGKLINPEAQYGFIIDMEGEKTYRALERIFARELIAYCSEKAFSIEGHDFKAGSVFLRRRGNSDDLPEVMAAVAKDIGIDIIGVNSGRSSDGSYLGAPTFRLMIQPRIALVTGSPLNFTSAGSLWFTIDHELRLPHSLIQASGLWQVNLAPYNVLVIPSAWGDGLSKILSGGVKEKIEQWVSGGGTLVCTGSSAEWAADTATGLSQVRLRRQALDKLDKYDLGLERELRAENPPVDTMSIYHPELTEKPEKTEKSPPPDIKELEEIDKWQRKFRPGGTILRANLEKEDWLAFGMKNQVPVMVYTRTALMATKPVKTTARFANDNNLRLSGLLWPEARQRWATTAYATHERKGRGQIILFATDPNMRAYFYGTRKLFVNAIIYGPAMTGAFYEYGQ